MRAKNGGGTWRVRVGEDVIAVMDKHSNRHAYPIAAWCHARVRGRNDAQRI